jgi:CubicO group peptidase (beta-lactamase class C family)
MKTSILFIAITIMWTSVFAQMKDNQQLIYEFDKLLASEFKPDEPGAVVLISKKGEVIYKKALGMAHLELNQPMQMDNVFWIASIGKQFTAIAILQLMEQGKLNLQDEITRFLPDYPTQGTKITIEHLLTHTSGIHNFSGMPDPEKKLALDCTPEEVINFFKHLPMRFTPGTKWEYSNSGYVLLGYIIEKITGNSYANYLEEHIFKPLGMTQSLYASDKKIIKNRAGSYTIGKQGFQNATSRNISNVYAAGAIQSTADDFFKWHRALHSYKLVKKETLDKAFTGYQLQDGTKTEYGYGWRLGSVYEYPSIWHGGLITGFGTVELYLPEQDVFVIVFSNCDCYYPKDLASRLAALAIGKTYEYKEIPVAIATLKKYTGVYKNKKGQERIITLSENQLYSQLGRGPKSRLKAYQADQFYFENDTRTTIEFSQNKKAVVVHLITKKLDGIEIWQKTNLPLPDSNGSKVDSKILDTYVGEYEIPSVMRFSVTKVKDRLFIQAEGQDSFELFAETVHTFFTKVNDAEFEFVKDENGKVIKVILSQGGRKAEAKKLK